jgi:hypothetical protein
MKKEYYDFMSLIKKEQFQNQEPDLFGTSIVGIVAYSALISFLFIVYVSLKVMRSIFYWIKL